MSGADGDIDPLFCEFARDGFANASAGTRNDSDFTGQFQIHTANSSGKGYRYLANQSRI